MTLQTLVNVSSELLPNRVDFSIRFPCFFQKPTNRKKLSAHGKTKSKHNWIGLEAGGEKKTTTRSNQKCKCATISKCAQNAFNGYKNRQRQQQRQALKKERREGRGLPGADCERLPPTNLVRSDIFILHIVHPKSVGSCLHLSALAGPITDALAKPIFDLHGKLSAGCTLLQLLHCLCRPLALATGAWLQQLIDREGKTVQHSVLHPHLCYKCNCCYFPLTLPPTLGDPSVALVQRASVLHT